MTFPASADLQFGINIILRGDAAHVLHPGNDKGQGKHGQREYNPRHGRSPLSFADVQVESIKLTFDGFLGIVGFGEDVTPNVAGVVKLGIGIAIQAIRLFEDRPAGVVDVDFANKILFHVFTPECCADRQLMIK